jgi:hypothetical protein
MCTSQNENSMFNDLSLQYPQKRHGLSKKEKREKIECPKSMTQKRIHT